MDGRFVHTFLQRPRFNSQMHFCKFAGRPATFVIQSDAVKRLGDAHLRRALPSLTSRAGTNSLEF